MTASQARISARRVCWLSIRHGRVRSDIGQSSQIVAQLMRFDTNHHSFVRRSTGTRLAAPVPSKLVSSPAAPKSP
jgi:hypothetical protein